MTSAGSPGIDAGAAVGPLRSLVAAMGTRRDLSSSLGGRRGKAACGQAAALRWSGLRFAPTALRCSVSRPPTPNSLRSLRSLRSNNVDESVHEARCARGPQALRFSAPQEARRSLPASPFADVPGVSAPKSTTGLARRAVCLAGSLSGAEERSAVVGARSALRELTRRRCLNAVSAANEVSSAPRPWGEHRRGVVAKRRPPLRELARQTACRAAPPAFANSRARMSATGREQTRRPRPDGRRRPATLHAWVQRP
jgi:hypothetical protein